MKDSSCHGYPFLLLKVDILGGTGIFEVLLIVLLECPPHTLGYMSHRVLRDEDVTCKPVQHWVLGDETEITVVFRMASTERDVLHLEEVTTSVKLS